MRKGSHISVIIPVFNEEHSIRHVIQAIPSWADDIIVVDNGSSDKTAEIARMSGARVINEPRRGYGSACLAGIEALDNPQVVVFLDGDFSDYPDEMAFLVDPIVDGEADMVIGSRVLGQIEKGALTPQQRFGNWLACTLIHFFWKIKYTDLGPFRAIRLPALMSLNMHDRDYGWTVEMQIKAAREGLRIREVPIKYRKRIGKSKVSGTVRGVIYAGTKILTTIFFSGIDTFISNIMPRKTSERLIVFTRYPQSGQTKTRLIPKLGPDGAAELQRKMGIHTMFTVRRFIHRHPLSMEVQFEGGSKDVMRTWLGSDISYHPQYTGDLGNRMARAFRAAFHDGMKHVVIVGTDSPGLTESHLQESFDNLKHSNLVVGPARDGGYYLIGLGRKSSKRAIKDLFTAIPWGTNDVLNKTMNIAKNSKLSYSLLEPLDDIDKPEDLILWKNTISQFAEAYSSEKISIIIPTSNESKNLRATLDHAKRGTNCEIIVVDSGSGDNTAKIAFSRGLKVLTTSSGRSMQMNAGACVASGYILLFLHADTLLPYGFDYFIRHVLSNQGVVAGAFELGIDSPQRKLRIIERLVNWRSRRLNMPYGDQAIFM
ncbi:MAG TPA: DUF2064 domain-containing protein, partial [bacterium]|nr:DUF2064 domain-containing protein [bacterium]